jgi:hypothetical protein
MRTDGDTCASDSLESKRLGEKARRHSDEERDKLMLSNSERLCCRTSIFMRNRATGLVYATPAFASFVARGIRENARCCRQPQRCHKHRQRCRLPHRLND